MRNKGLTLIELLAVLIVIAILGTITFVSVLSKIEDTNKKSEKLLISSIENSAELYILENRYNYSEGTFTITVQNLIDAEYLRKDNLKNPLTKENIDTSTLINITIEKNNKLTVTYDLNQ